MAEARARKAQGGCAAAAAESDAAAPRAATAALFRTPAAEIGLQVTRTLLNFSLSSRRLLSMSQAVCRTCGWNLYTRRENMISLKPAGIKSR
jgi:hypothetical protein